MNEGNPDSHYDSIDLDNETCSTKKAVVTIIQGNYSSVNLYLNDCLTIQRRKC